MIDKETRQFIIQTNQGFENRLKDFIKSFVTEFVTEFVTKQHETLAQMVARGFAETHSRIDEIGQRFEKRFDGIDRRFDRVEAMLRSHQDQIDSLRDDTVRVKKFIGFPNI
jgi:hypothetical protein